MSAHSILGVGLVSALFIAGCNGSGEGPTPAPAPTTTTVPTTTAAPTTTVDPLAAEEAAVSEAAKQARLASIYAYQNLDDPAAIAALDDYYVAASPARKTVDQSIADLRREGWRLRAHPTIVDSVAVEEVALAIGQQPAAATLVVCVVDAATLYEPGGAPDGSDVIVNDTVYSHRLVYEMQKVGGSWKLASVSEIGSWEGVVECPAAS